MGRIVQIDSSLPSMFYIAQIVQVLSFWCLVRLLIYLFRDLVIHFALLIYLTQKILASKSASLLFICFFCFAYFSEYSLIFILIISQSSESFTVLSFLYSCAMVFIITGIWLIYSISLINDVLSFQYPGPLGFVLRVKAIVIIE